MVDALTTGGVHDRDAGVSMLGDGDADTGRQCPGPGCPCVDESAAMGCYPPPVFAADGSEICTRGTMYCRAGTWSACETLFDSTSTAAVGSSSSASTVRAAVSALVAGPTTCSPCHPDCFDSLDRPVASDLTTSDESALSYDPTQAGIALTAAVVQRGPTNTLAVCGNGVVEDLEQCDDGNTRAGDGCDSNCLLESGYFCPVPGSACQRSVCGNAVVEGLEQCDDGNDLIGDGCTFLCTLEPHCVTGQPCSPVCGDGQVFSPEQCDDGNVRSGDGCSSTCTLEPGWNCGSTASTPPAYLDIPIVYRDFVGVGLVNAPTGTPYVHQDFEHYNTGLTRGMVKTVWETNTTLPTYKKPVAVTPLPANHALTSVPAFNQWYTDDRTVNLTFDDTLRVTRQTDGTYVFDTTAFFPLDSRPGWPSRGAENLSNGHDFSFTSELRFWFQYNPPQALSFRGDDDVWVFINGTLAVDIGGIHSATSGSVTLNSSNAATFNLVPGNLYEAAVFQAERHTTGSNYRLTLAGFYSGSTSCTSICGDGIVTAVEFCDDGANNGKPGYCLADCSGRPTAYPNSGTYWRTYSATGICNIPPERAQWGMLNWSAVPLTNGAGITFQLQAAETTSALASAPVVSATVPAGTASGSFDLTTLMLAASVDYDAPYLLVTVVLTPSPDLHTTPVLQQFDVDFTCVNVE